MAKQEEFAKIIISAVKGNPIQRIRSTYKVLQSVERFGDKHLYYVPGFDIHFAASSFDEAEVKSKAMVASFFDFWVKIQGAKNFILELNRLGFKAPQNDYEVQNLIKNRKVGNTNFRINRNAVENPFEVNREISVKNDYAGVA